MDKKQNIFDFCRGKRNIGTTILDGVKKLFERTKDKCVEKDSEKE